MQFGSADFDPKRTRFAPKSLNTFPILFQYIMCYEYIIQISQKDRSLGGNCLYKPKNGKTRQILQSCMVVLNSNVARILFGREKMNPNDPKKYFQSFRVIWVHSFLTKKCPSDIRVPYRHNTAQFVQHGKIRAKNTIRRIYKYAEWPIPDWMVIGIAKQHCSLLWGRRIQANGTGKKLVSMLRQESPLISQHN